MGAFEGAYFAELLAQAPASRGRVGKVAADPLCAAARVHRRRRPPVLPPTPSRSGSCNGSARRGSRAGLL